MRNKQLILSIIFMLGFSITGIQAQNDDDVIIAKRIKLNSTVLGEERTIYISIPAGYDGSKSTYPVFYVLNGSAQKIHFVSGLVSGLAQRGHCPEMIVVAIAHTQGWRDMTPTKSSKNYQGVEVEWPQEPGGGDKFLKFIETELFPFVEKNYRTAPYRIYTGHSAGGMAVTHAFLSHTNMFNAYIASSPSLWWDNQLFIRTADEKIEKMNLKHKQFYFNMGANESSDKIKNGSTFSGILRKKAPPELIWKYDLIENENHASQEPIAIYNGLRFLFDGWRVTRDDLAAGGLSSFQDYYRRQTEKYGYEIVPSESEMNGFGYTVMRGGKLDEAIQIFEKICFDYPKSPNAFDSLAEAYLADGKIDLSIKNYEKAVALSKEIKDGRLEYYKANLEQAKASKK